MHHSVSLSLPLNSLINQLPDITLARALSLRLSKNTLQNHLRNSRGITPLERELCRFIDDYEESSFREPA